MKKILIISSFIFLFYACRFEEVTSYKEVKIDEIDTLSIERIKIETH